MNILRWWARQGIFRKTFMLLVLLIAVVVTLAEGLLEPFAQNALLEASGGWKPWHELILWAVSIIIPSLICGYIFSRALARKLERMAAAADRVAHGDFAARTGLDENGDDAFGHLNASFNSMAASLEKLIQNERRLLTDISHELRSPLARMSISLELLPMKKDKARDELIDRLEKEVAVMSRMVELLLAQGRERLARKKEDVPVDISVLLAEVADDIRFQGQIDGKEVVCDCTQGLFVNGHGDQLRTMLMNVASNALFYTPPGQSVAIRLIRNGEQATISIRDFGPGVPEEKLQDIFRAFYRVDDSRTRASGGAGLGLALAREAAESCGGKITARNVQPGLEVLIVLPACAGGQGIPQ